MRNTSLQGFKLIAIKCRLDILVAETYGEESQSILETATLWNKNVSAIIGPMETCIHEVPQPQHLLTFD